LAIGDEGGEMLAIEDGGGKMGWRGGSSKFTSGDGRSGGDDGMFLPATTRKKPIMMRQMMIFTFISANRIFLQTTKRVS
jgi:hypothetical protein